MSFRTTATSRRRGEEIRRRSRRNERSYRGSRAQKRRSSTVTNAATSTSTANATTIPQMNGSAVSAEPIKTATPTRKAIPSRMKTTHKTSLRVMMGERSTTPEFDPDPAGLPPSGNPYIRLARRLPVDVSLPLFPDWTP
jgi:hypothetical protein